MIAPAIPIEEIPGEEGRIGRPVIRVPGAEAPLIEGLEWSGLVDVANEARRLVHADILAALDLASLLLMEDVTGSGERK